MNIVFMGTPVFSLPTLHQLYKSDHNIELVVTQPDRPKGRGRKSIPPPVKQFALENRLNQDRRRQSYLDRQQTRRLLSLEQARKNRTPIDWSESLIERPSFEGIRVFGAASAGSDSILGIPLDYLPGISLETLLPFIDWTPFFQVWELRGRYPGILEDVRVGQEARRLYSEAQEMLDEWSARQIIRLSAVCGFFRANSVEDDILLFQPNAKNHVLTVFHTLRQQSAKESGKPNRALADFIAPSSSGKVDYLGAFVVTAGREIEALALDYEKRHDDFNSILVKSLGDRLAEACAEYLHLQMRHRMHLSRLHHLLKIGIHINQHLNHMKELHVIHLKRSM